MRLTVLLVGGLVFILPMLWLLLAPTKTNPEFYSLEPLVPGGLSWVGTAWEHLVQKTEQFQTSLVGVLASIQDGAQQAVDALSQHAPAPRATEYLVQGIPGMPDLLRSQQRSCFIQAFFPKNLSLEYPERFHRKEEESRA